MPVQVKKLGIFLEPTANAFEAKAVFNPGCIERAGATHMFYRALSAENISTIGYCRIENGTVVDRLPYPLLTPEYEYERRGLEDPRILYLEGTYYLFYTAYDGKNALVAYATSKDLVSFTKQGLVTPKIPYAQADEYFHAHEGQSRYDLYAKYFENHVEKGTFLWEKDAFLFPKRIGGKLAFLHRIMPGIQIMYAESLEDLNEKHWTEYLQSFENFIVLEPKHPFENVKLGGGCIPIETPDGWLLIYHAIEYNEKGQWYHAAAALLDRENPVKVIGRLPYPLFSPVEEWEKEGVVPNVVFPSGTSLTGDDLTIYYGAADTRIGAATVSLSELLAELKCNPHE